MSKCQNCQDRRIPIAKAFASSDYGIGAVVDIEGNCRFYDLIRFRKMAKVSSLNSRDSEALSRSTSSQECSLKDRYS
jgi:hypothetical protein